MVVLNSEAIAAARKLVRTFKSAPDPRARALLVQSTLARVAGWEPWQRESLEAFGSWLSTYPPPRDLQPRCADLLDSLGLGPTAPPQAEARRRR